MDYINPFKQSGPTFEKICDASSDEAAAFALNGKFDKESCSFFENCDHLVERHDYTRDGTPIVAGLYYCSMDWKKVLPLVLLFVVIVFFIWRKMRSVSWPSGSGSHSSSSGGYKKYFKRGRH